MTGKRITDLCPAMEKSINVRASNKQKSIYFLIYRERTISIAIRIGIIFRAY